MRTFSIFSLVTNFLYSYLHYKFRGPNILRNVMLFWDCSLVCSSDSSTLKELLFAAWPLS